MSEIHIEDASFDKLFDPADISDWITSTPAEIITNTTRCIVDEANQIKLIAYLLLTNPQLQEIRNSSIWSDKTVQDAMVEVMKEVRRIDRIASKLRNYAEYVDKNTISLP